MDSNKKRVECCVQLIYFRGRYYILPLSPDKMEFCFENRPLRFIIRVVVDLFSPKDDVCISIRGLKMYANRLDRIIAILLWKYYGLESYNMKIVEKIVDEGDVVIDLGANIGYYTLNLSRFVGKGGKVFAFEPADENFRLLTKNVVENSCDNVICIKKAVSEKTGVIKLYICGEHSGDHRIYDSKDSRPSVEIDSTTIDDFMDEVGVVPDFIKMDIQGSEYLAMKGLAGVIKKNPNVVILSEFDPFLLNKSGASIEDFVGILRLYGLRAFHLDGGEKGVNEVDLLNLSGNLPKVGWTNILLAKELPVQIRLS
jgi:FkbM family methyltransferase